MQVRRYQSEESGKSRVNISTSAKCICGIERRATEMEQVAKIPNGGAAPACSYSCAAYRVRSAASFRCSGRTRRRFKSCLRYSLIWPDTTSLDTFLNEPPGTFSKSALVSLHLIVDVESDDVSDALSEWRWFLAGVWSVLLVEPDRSPGRRHDDYPLQRLSDLRPLAR